MQTDAQTQESAAESGNGDDLEIDKEFLGTVLENLRLDEHTDWEHLSPEQQAAFIKAVDSGKLGLLPDAVYDSC